MLNSRKRHLLLYGCTFGTLLLLIYGFEIYRLLLASQTPFPLVDWMLSFNIDVSPYALLLLGFPLVWKWSHPRTLSESSDPATSEPSVSLHLRSHWLFPVAIFALSLLMSLLTRSSIPGNPPVYHDEYSYLFQAETFALGRLSNPGFQPAPHLFDQMHVLNESGRMTSRYFPATGMWLMPFVMIGHPHWGPWLAMAITAVLVYRAGQLLSGTACGLIAGVLTALSPGMVLFGQLLLSHHVCVLLLSLLLVAFLTAEKSSTSQKRYGWLLVAATALALAMLSRPMTAAGFGLPFGFVLLRQMLFQPGEHPTRFRLLTASAFVVPIALALGFLGLCNKAATGDYFTTAYSRYTQQHTPSHVYGFYNRTRGDAAIADAETNGTPLPVLTKYDQWATELTPAMSISNAFVRLISSWQWTLGLIPMLCCTMLFLLNPPGRNDNWWLVAAAILSIHLLHIPYWFDGIFHWHYVFETAPLWVMIAARSMLHLTNNAIQISRPLLAVYAFAFPLFAVSSSYIPLSPLWDAQYWSGMSQIEFTQALFEQLDEAVDQIRKGKPAVVVITANPDDVHTDFVLNSPQLNASVLKVHDLRPEISFGQLQQWFPDRVLIHYDQVLQTLSEVEPGPN